MPCIRNMTNDEFIFYCREKGLSESDIILAELIFRVELRGNDLYKASGYCKSSIIRKRKQIKELLKNETSIRPL